MVYPSNPNKGVVQMVVNTRVEDMVSDEDISDESIETYDGRIVDLTKYEDDILEEMDVE